MKQKTILTPVESALALVLKGSLPAPAVAKVPLADALGKVLAQAVIAKVDVPPKANSAVDGYCFRYSDLTASPLPVSQRIAAGYVPAPLAPGTAARIFTGAELPGNADTVVMQESASENAEGVVFQAQPAMGQNVRPQGQDLKQGEIVLAKGQRLRPQELGLLASVGEAELLVYQPLRVAIFATGDEVVEPDQPLLPGQIYNSNRYLLSGLLQGLGFEIFDIGIARDSLSATIEAFKKAEQADVIISTGGVSVGEEDHVQQAIRELDGSVDLWQLAIKPGKPFTYGQVLNTAYFGLPGNPAAVLVTFCMLCHPWLLKSQGANQWQPTVIRAQADFAQPRQNKRQEYLRARLNLRDGCLWVEPHPNQSSGMLSSACWAQGLAVVPAETTVARGDTVDFIGFDQFLN